VRGKMENTGGPEHTGAASGPRRMGAWIAPGPQSDRSPTALQSSFDSACPAPVRRPDRAATAIPLCPNPPPKAVERTPEFNHEPHEPHQRSQKTENG